jgi:hypothetical protein
MNLETGELFVVKQATFMPEQHFEVLTVAPRRNSSGGEAARVRNSSLKYAQAPPHRVVPRDRARRRHELSLNFFGTHAWGLRRRPAEEVRCF